MKNNWILILIVIGCFSCKKENLGDCFKSTGSIVEEERLLSSFTHIELNDRINLYVTYAPTQKLTVKAGKNLQKFIRTEVNGNTLSIENDNRCNWVRSFKKEIDVYLSTPNITEILYYGSGELRFQNTFITDTLLVNLWEASGDLYFDLEATYVELKTHTGVGTISCKGTAEELVAFVGGNGFVDAAATPAKKVLAVNESTGNMKVQATQKLEAFIRGDGNIEYIGSPTIDLLKAGKGKLIKIEE